MELSKVCQKQWLRTYLLTVLEKQQLKMIDC